MKMNLLRKVKTVLCVILSLVSLLCVLNTYAIPYDHLFTQYLGTGSVANAKSPCRGANPFVYNNVGIISKMNQARKSNGTNPHQGTDFYMSAGTDVYPIMSGTVYYIDNSNEYQEQHIVIKSTINNVDYYVTYLHIEPVGNLQVNDIVDEYDKIGEVASKVIWDPHLHITCQKYEDQILYKTGLYQFFRTNASYNYGQDMDVITAGHFYGDTFYVTAYFRSNGGNNPDGMAFHCKSLTIYYKIYHVRTQNESMHSITYVTSIDPNTHTLTYPSNYDPSTFTYYINFSHIDGSECGDTIQFYIAVVREGHSDDDDCDFNTVFNDGTMDYSIWPMYYDRPAKDMAGASVIIYGDSYINSYTHQWSEWTTTKQPTCTTDGTESRSCNYCEVTEDRILCSPGHSYNDVTCELAATCTRCGATTGSNLGHSMSGWSVVTSSTCSTPGTQSRYCTRTGCNYTENDSIPALGHSYNDATCELAATCTRCSATIGSNLGHSMSGWSVVTSPTCSTSGTKSKYCTRTGCSYTEYDSISALGHSMSSWSVITPSTCCIPGTQTRTCTRSGCSYSENGSLPLNPNNHSGGSYWTVTTAATCTTSGIRSQKCYGCSAVLSTQTISALGHNWGSWIYQYTEYDEDLQYYVRVYKRTCSRCGAVEYDYLE